MAAAVTVSQTLTAWDQVVDIDAAANDVVLTLPSVASQDGEIRINRLDNTANIVAIRPSGAEAFVGVPAETTYITLLGGGSLRVRAISGTGVAKIDWSRPQNASKLWLPTTANLASILGWWDALSITGLADGALLAAWNDSSGAGRNFSQGTAGNQPTYRAAVAALNTLPAVETTNTTSRMDAAATYSSDEMSVVFLHRTPASFPADARIFGPSASNSTLAFRYGGGVNFVHTNVAHMANANTLQQASATELRTATFSDASNNIIYRRNGAADGTPTYAGDVPTTATTLRLFGEAALNLAPTGLQLAGLVIASAALPTADLERIEGALAHRYGLTATVLAAGHIYRITPPLLALVAY